MGRWNIKNNAVLRTALFFEVTHLKLDSLENLIFQNSGVFKNKHEIFQSCYDYICSLIDEFFTPFIIKEINNKHDTLIGATSQERYSSFFLTSDAKWKKDAIYIETKYAVQIDRIFHLIQTEIKSLICFFNRLINDIPEIDKKFNVKNQIIKSIEVTNSDRHNFVGTVIFVLFSNNTKIVYKSKNMDYDICLREIIKLLNCEKLLYFPKYINKKAYSWSEFIVHELYNKKDLHLLYKNFGLQLAIFDVLNFTDGHAENFVTYDKKFVSVDTETVFTNLSYFEDRAENFYDLSFTGMIRPQNKKMPYQPLLRKIAKLSYFPYKPFICNDETDLISMQYHQVMKNVADNSFPTKGKINLKNYKEDIINGLILGYNLVKQHKKEILIFLRNMNIRTRQIVRPTLYYIWIIYRYLHPDNKYFEKFLEKNLHNLGDNLFTYEKKYIKFGNIPVCYQKLHSRHLYGYDKIIEKNYFSHTSYYWIKSKIESVNDSFIEKRILEIKKSVR